MENQLITTTNTPRITLKKLAPDKKDNELRYSWEIASSSHKDKDELKKIVEMLTEINGEMKNKFIKIIKRKKLGVTSNKK